MGKEPKCVKDKDREWDSVRRGHGSDGGRVCGRWRGGIAGGCGVRVEVTHVLKRWAAEDRWGWCAKGDVGGLRNGGDVGHITERAIKEKGETAVRPFN